MSSVFAEEDNIIPTPQSSLIWPLNKGPPGLGDSILAIITLIIIPVIIFSKRKWPHKFQDSTLGFLLVCSTLAGFCIMGDGRTSRTTLFSIGVLQVYLGQLFARMRHRISDHRWYTMSVLFWPIIFILTVGFALLCMKASPAMYNQNTQLPWFQFTIPCFGVAVGACVYLGYLWKSCDVSPLPRYDHRGRRGSV